MEESSGSEGRKAEVGVGEAARPVAAPPPIAGVPGALPVAEYWTPVPAQTNGAAVAGLVLGICSLLLNLLTGIPGIVFSILGIRQARVIGGHGQGLAIAGLVLSCFGTLLGVVFIAVFVVAVRSAATAGAFSMATASNNARMSSTMSMLQSLRAQTELYRLQHQDRYPTLAEMQNWSVFLQRTDEDGTVNPAGKYGPYLMAPPMNPLTGSSVVVPANKPVSPAGWAYDPTTGKIWAAVKAPTPGLPAADVVIVP